MTSVVNSNWLVCVKSRIVQANIRLPDSGTSYKGDTS